MQISAHFIPRSLPRLTVLTPRGPLQSPNCGSYRTTSLSDARWREFGWREQVGSPNDALPMQNRLGHSTRHHLIAIDERQEEPEVLLRAAQVIAERRAPLLAVRLQRVLEVGFLQRLAQRVDREDRAPAVRINVLAAR